MNNSNEDVRIVAPFWRRYENNVVKKADQPESSDSRPIFSRSFPDPFPPSPFPLFSPPQKGTIRIFLSSFPSR